MVHIGYNRNRPLQDKLSKWASSKTNMVKLQEDLLKKEHKLQLMKSHHQHIIEVEKRESYIKIELMEQKHAKEIKLLDLEIETFKFNLRQSSFNK